MTFPLAHQIQRVGLSVPDASIQAVVMDLGATLYDLHVRRPDGAVQRVVLGLADPTDYPEHSPHMGAIAGRFGNRIGRGHFVLDGQAYQLPLNENGCTALHGGGRTGFGKSLWVLLHHDAGSATFAHHSPAGHNGYPGALTVTCRYTLAPPQTLRLELWATTDAPTVVNLCHHSYFNLDGSTDVLGHRLAVRANVFAPTDVDMIPVGTLAPVAGTPLDFRRPRAIANTDYRPLDNTFILRRDREDTESVSDLRLALAATLMSVRSRLAVECWTTEPALQVYDGHKLTVQVPGHDGVRYGRCAGIALEPQHVPDSPNLPHFPSTVLRPGQLYRQLTEYRFRAATESECSE